MQRVHYSDEDPLSVINAGVEAAARRDGWAPHAKARSPRPVRRSAARAVELMARAASATAALPDRLDVSCDRVRPASRLRLRWDKTVVARVLGKPRRRSVQQ